MRTFIRIIAIGASVLAIIFLALHISSLNLGVLDPKGVIAVAEKKLLLTALGLMMMVIIPVFVMLGAFAWRYRASNAQAKYTPDWHGNTTLEVVWWIIPAVIVLILSCITWKSTHDLDPYKPIESSVAPITIQVVALDWKWLFIYPEERIATVNFIEFPKDTPINFEITADAPMNAFWIPQLAGQVYAMAGMTAKLHLMAHEEGRYRGLSSNFSGDGFSGMTFEAKAVSRLEYDAWVNDVQKSPQALTLSRYHELVKQSKNNPVEYYASVVDDLYTTIIMKFMAHPVRDEKEVREMDHMMDHKNSH